MLVVGGGITGLAAAHRLVERAREEALPPVVVLETSERLGGQIRTERRGDLVLEAGPDTLVVVLSDHGFRTARRGDSPNISGDHYNTAPPGVILLAGAGVPAGLELARASVADIAPTVLHVMGLPIARDMNGRVMPELERGEAEWIASYGSTEPGPGAAPIATEHDAAMVEKLRALGYLD